MLGGKKILAVVPARGGSKGIKLKNLRKIGQQTLIEKAASVLADVDIIDRCVVSTDHSLIAENAHNAGLEVPFVRDEMLSGDFVSDLDVLTDALIRSQDHFNTSFDYVVMIQPTSPLRTSTMVRDCIELCVTRNLDSVWTVSVSDTKNHPQKQLLLDKTGRLAYYDKNGASIVARQQLTPTYSRNGVAYCIASRCLIEKTSISGDDWVGLVINEPQISIDTELDLDFANWLITRGGLA